VFDEDRTPQGRIVVMVSLSREWMANAFSGADVVGHSRFSHMVLASFRMHGLHHSERGSAPSILHAEPHFKGL
jgi:hypothetical protein